MNNPVSGGCGRRARCRTCFSLLASAVALAVGLSPVLCAWADPVADTDARAAVMAEAPTRGVLQAVERAGKRLVAVGERGLILLSDDNGVNWRQARVPVSVGITAVHFPTPLQGWAVGHFGTVLHTDDGGETWHAQLTGAQAAGHVLAEAQALPANAEPSLAALAHAKQMVAEGPDKPFLSVFFGDVHNGLVVGAFGLILRTTDGGKTWRSLSAQLDNPGARHLYTIASGGGSLYIAGEEGRVYRSDDQGSSFLRLRTPYQGSYFTVAANDSGVVVAGLRGNVLRSSDRGETWTSLTLLNSSSIVASVFGNDGKLLLLNQAGQLLQGGNSLGPLHAVNTSPLPAPTGLALADSGELLISSLQGIVHLNLPSHN